MEFLVFIWAITFGLFFLFLWQVHPLTILALFVAIGVWAYVDHLKFQMEEAHARGMTLKQLRKWKGKYK